MNIVDLGAKAKAILTDTSRSFEVVVSDCQNVIDKATTESMDDKESNRLKRLITYGVFSSAVSRGQPFNVVDHWYRQACDSGFDNDWFRMTAGFLFAGACLQNRKYSRALAIAEDLNEAVQGHRESNLNGDVEKIEEIVVEARARLKRAAEYRKEARKRKNKGGRAG